MQSRTLGTSAVEVSELCLGAMHFGTRMKRSVAFALLDQFVDAGGTFIDTANNYSFWDERGVGGESEAVLGAWLRERGNRDRVVIATKCGAMPAGPAPGSTAGGSVSDVATAGFASAEGLSEAAITSAIEGSLRRLGIEHVDLYYAHIDDRRVPVAETMGAFARLIEAGKVRAIGCSNFATWRIAESRAAAGAAGTPAYAAAQFRYTYLRPNPGADLDVQVAVDDQLRDYCRSNGVTLLAYSPLLQGAYSRSRDGIPTDYASADSVTRLDVLAQVAAEVGAPPTQVVLAWLRQQDPPVIPLVTASRPEQLTENLGSLDVTLSSEHMDRLSSAHA